MTTKPFKNPFESDDVIWFEGEDGPFDFHVILPDDMTRSVKTKYEIPLRDVIIYHENLPCSGPYRLEKSENWSGYDFGVR